MGLISWDSLARRIFGDRKRDSDTGGEAGTPPQPFGIALGPVRAGGLVTIAFGPHSVPVTGVDTSVGPPKAKPTPVDREIVAYRGWHLAKDTSGVPQLLSFRGTPWDGPSLVADEVPDSDNTNGIYALLPNNPHRQSYEHSCSVWGTVALSGIVVEGEMGYRGERATVRTLKVVRHPDELRDSLMLEITSALEDRYQCPVEMDGDRIWHNTPDEELVPAQIYQSSAMTQVSPYQVFNSAQSFRVSGFNGYGTGLLGGRRRR